MKRTTLLLLATAATLPATFAFASVAKTYTGRAGTPASSSEKEIAALFDRWNAALATGRPDQVARLYATNGVLAPTVSNEVRDTPAKIHDYFTKFLLLKPQGQINYRQIRVLDDNTALDTGVYTFSLNDSGKTSKVQARYTYLYEKVGGEWKIMNHHSSAMPEPVDSSKL
jgi:uncharacterized protein (TIGR02246 family)